MITVGHGHAEQWWRQFCYRLRLNGYDGWLSIEYEEMSLGRVEGVRRSVYRLRAVVPVDAADFETQGA